MSLDSARITQRRLHNQHLLRPRLTDPAAVVAYQGAVQAQDFAGARWALALRLTDTDEARLKVTFDRGDILRTHVLRPTWHFVTPADIRWLLALTGPRVLAATAFRRRQLGIDAKALARAAKGLQRAMKGGRHLTREEIRGVLRSARVRADDTERFAHVMLVLELEMLVCSGAVRGKHQTYALLDERAPMTPPMHRDDAVRELTRRYFTSHGPATVYDFAVWSGLTVGDARRGIEANGDIVACEEIDGKHWWFASGDGFRPTRGARRPRALLLPNYDEYFIGFKHREPLLERLAAHGMKPTTRDLLANVIVVDGQIVGGWRRVSGRGATTVELSPFIPLTPGEDAAIAAEVRRYATFLAS